VFKIDEVEQFLHYPVVLCNLNIWKHC